MSKPVKKIDNVEQIQVSNLQLMQYAHQTWAIVTRTPLSIDQLQHPDTWAFAASKLRPHDRVEILASNGSQLSKGIVTSVQGGAAKIQIYQHVMLSGAKHNEIEFEGYFVRHGGIDVQWVIVDPNGDVMKSDFGTDVAALNYLKDHFKTLMT